MEFLEDLYTRYPPSLAVKPILVMDNVRFHHSASFVAWCLERNIRLEYLPVYSPQLNPIEEVFSTIKARYRALRPRPSSEDEIRQAIISVLNDLVAYDFTNFFGNMRRYLQMVIGRVVDSGIVGCGELKVGTIDYNKTIRMTKLRNKQKGFVYLVFMSFILRQ